MDKKTILKKIIEERGDCDWIKKEPVDICKLCPMASSHNGSHVSCLFTVFGSNFDPRSMVGVNLHEAYLSKAVSLLEDMEVEDMLRGEDDHYAADSGLRKDS